MVVVVVIHRWEDGRGLAQQFTENHSRWFSFSGIQSQKSFRKKREGDVPRDHGSPLGPLSSLHLYGPMAFHSPRSSLGPHNHYQVRILLTLSSSILLGFPFFYSGLSEMSSVHCGLCNNCTGALIRRLTPSVHMAQWKENTVESLKWERSNVTGFQHRVCCLVWNLLSLQQSLKSPAKASGSCLERELDPFVWQLRKALVWEGTGVVTGQSALYMWNIPYM